MEIQINRPECPTFFGGIGFHNSEALFYRLVGKEQFDQKIGKCYREVAPGFMRTFAGYSDWSKESMDTFADYYERMQKVTDTPIYLACAKGKLHFNDEERRQYAEDVAKNLEYLVKVRGVKQLRYYCFSNELSIQDWGGLYNDMPLFQKYHEYLYEAFQNHGLNIGLLATDASNMNRWDSLDFAAKNMKQISEDFCLHAYINDYDRYDMKKYDSFYQLCRGAVMKSIQCDGKRFLLGEFGVTKGGNISHLPGVIRDVCSINEGEDAPFAALYMAELMMAAINAGVFTVVLWTFSDYPDPYVCHYAEHDEYAKKWGECEHFISQTQDVKYNKWGMIRWEDDGDYSVRTRFYCIGLLSRFCRRNAKVLSISADGTPTNGSVGSDALVRTCALLNRDGTVSIVAVNRNDKGIPFTVNLAKNQGKATLGQPYHHAQKVPFRVYQYDANHVPDNEFGDLPESVDEIQPNENGVLTYTLPPQSMTVFSTDYTTRGEVEAKNVVRSGNFLRWSPVTDSEHCYYRVYRGETADFVPSRENQIASTIAETLDFTAPYMEDSAILNVKGDYYKVISVACRR